MRATEHLRFELRLAAAVLGIAAVLCAGLAAAGTLQVWLTLPREPDGARETLDLLVPVATAVVLVPYLVVSGRFALVAARYALRGDRRSAVWTWGGAALGLSLVWVSVAFPFYGFLVASSLAPMLLFGLALVLLVVRLVRYAAQLCIARLR